MTDAAILDALQELIAVTRAQKADTWLDINAVAALLAFSVEYARDTIIVQPEFPTPARINGRGHPRWLRSEVQAWMRRQQR